MKFDRAARELNAFRPDIQGLRAVAVLSVLLFHLWPSVIPGGYVGVDVFFVISGFLISRGLADELRQAGTVSVAGFYGRRIRRLVPAATVVLIAVAAAIPLLPETEWENAARSVAASALYVENWHLARLAVDYWNSDAAPSPVQHYWSLSVEEQFYFIWPLTVWVAARLGRRLGRSAGASLIAALATITAVSLAASIRMTPRDPAPAYFVTHVRMWELGFGGLLALTGAGVSSRRVGLGLAAAGLLAVVASCALYSSATAFPGYAALLPVCGAGLVIVGGAVRPANPVLDNKVSQYIGDISYSLYLWHWPIIVFYGAIFGAEPTLAGGLAVLALSVVLAGLSKRFVEDRFRFGWRSMMGRPAIPFAFGAGAIALSVAVPAAVLAFADPSGRDLAGPGINRSQYPGAMAIFSHRQVPKVSEFLPPLRSAGRDIPGCVLSQEATVPAPCEYGHRGAKVHVVLAGDSHAANWDPALRVIAARQGWRLTVQTKSACPLLRALTSNRHGLYYACQEWGNAVLDELRHSPPDLVILSQTSLQQLAEEPGAPSSMEAAILEIRQELERMGSQVILIADGPNMATNLLRCTATKPAAECWVPREKAFRPDPILAIASARPEVPVIDMRDAFCMADRCPAVIGNLIVWRDTSHFTATYSRSMAPILEKRLLPLFRPRRQTSADAGH